MSNNRITKILIPIASLMMAGSAMAQQTVKGKVYSPDKETMTAALLYIDGTDVATLTNSQGKFELRVPKEYEGREITIVYDGYEPYVFVPTDKEMEITLVKSDIKNEVVETYVTTQKRLQTNTEVPIAIGVVDKAKSDNLGINRIEDIAYYIPGFQSNIQNCLEVNNVIRGVTSDGSDSYFQPRISVYLDGVSITRTSTASISLFDMERTEVVKGPQGTLFGRGAEIGAIQYITNKPTSKLEFMAKVEYGNYNHKLAEFVANTPINERVLNRFAIHYSDNDGYYSNLSGGRLNGQNALCVRDIIKLIPNEKTSINIALDYERNREPCTDYNCNKMGLPNDPNIPSLYSSPYFNDADKLCSNRDMGGINIQINRELSSTIELSSITGIRGYKGLEDYDADGTYLPLMHFHENTSGLQASQEVRLNWDNGGKLKGFMGAAFYYETAKHRISIETNLNNLFPMQVAPSLSKQFEQMPELLAGTLQMSVIQAGEYYKAGFPAYAEAIDMMMAQVGQSVHDKILSSMNSQMDKWFGSDVRQWDGTPDFYGSIEEIVNTALTSSISELFEQMPEAQAIMGGTPEQIVAGLGISEQLSSNENLATVKAISGIPLQDYYEENETDYHSAAEGDIFGDISWNFSKNFFLTAGLRGTYEHKKTGYMSTSMSAPLVNTVVYQSSNGDKVWVKYDELSWVGRLAINWLFNPNNNIYASVSRGRRPGCQYFNFTPDETAKLKPEYITSYEAGIKGNILRGHFLYSLSQYYYNWTDFQTYVNYTRDDGTKSYRSDNLGKAHTLGTEASVKFFFPKYLTLTMDYCYLDGQFDKKNTKGEDQMYYGNSFRLTSKHTGDVIFSFEFPVNRGPVIYFCPSASYQSSLYFENDNADDLFQEGYALVNANAGCKWQKGKVSYNAGLWAKNITNKKYIIDGGNTGSAIGFNTYIPGAPATVGVRFAMEF